MTTQCLHLFTSVLVGKLQETFCLEMATDPCEKDLCGDSSMKTACALLSTGTLDGKEEFDTNL